MVTTDFEGQDVIITFEKEGDTEAINMQARILSMNLSGGSGDVETVRTFGGSSFQVNKPTGEYEISFDYVTQDSSFSEVNLDDATEQGMPAVGIEIRSGAEGTKKRWRVIIWFLGEGAGVSANSAIPPITVPLKVGEILRYIFTDCYGVTNEEAFSADDYARGTITLRTGAKDENAYPNVFKEYTSAEGTTALTVLNATAHKGTLTWNTTTPAWTADYR